MVAVNSHDPKSQPPNRDSQPTGAEKPLARTVRAASHQDDPTPFIALPCRLDYRLLR